MTIDTKWPKERDTRLYELSEQLPELSFSEIAQKLTVSKYSVLERWRRLGLPARQSFTMEDIRKLVGFLCEETPTWAVEFVAEAAQGLDRCYVNARQEPSKDWLRNHLRAAINAAETLTDLLSYPDLIEILGAQDKHVIRDLHGSRQILERVKDVSKNALTKIKPGSGRGKAWDRPHDSDDRERCASIIVVLWRGLYSAQRFEPTGLQSLRAANFLWSCTGNESTGDCETPVQWKRALTAASHKNGIYQQWLASRMASKRPLDEAATITERAEN